MSWSLLASASFIEVRSPGMGACRYVLRFAIGKPQLRKLWRDATSPESMAGQYVELKYIYSEPISTSRWSFLIPDVTVSVPAKEKIFSSENGVLLRGYEISGGYGIVLGNSDKLMVVYLPGLLKALPSDLKASASVGSSLSEVIVIKKIADSQFNLGYRHEIINLFNRDLDPTSRRRFVLISSPLNKHMTPKRLEFVEANKHFFADALEMS